MQGVDEALMDRVELRRDDIVRCLPGRAWTWSRSRMRARPPLSSRLSRTIGCTRASESFLKETTPRL